MDLLFTSAILLVTFPWSLSAAYPDAIVAETQKLGFHVSTPSAKGSLEGQVRKAMDDLFRKNRGAVIVKLRVFASGPQLVTASKVIEKIFTAKKLPLPVLALLGVAGFPEKGQLVEIESTASGEPANRQGLAFLAGLASPAGDRTIAGMARVAPESGVSADQVLRVSCFSESLDYIAAARKAIADSFPKAEASFVYSYASAAKPLIECEAVARLTESSSERVRYFNLPGTQPSPLFSRASLVTAPKLAFLSMQTASGESETEVRRLFDRLNSAADRVGARLAETVMAGNYWMTDAARDRLREMRMQHYGKTVPAATGVFFAALDAKESTAALELTVAAPEAIALRVGSPLIDGRNLYKSHRARMVQTVTKDGVTTQSREFNMDKSVVERDGITAFRLLIDSLPGSKGPKYHSETLLNLRNMALVYREDRIESGLTRILHVDGSHVSGYEQNGQDANSKPIDFTTEEPSFYFLFVDAAVNAATLHGGDVFRIATFDLNSRRTEWRTYAVSGEDTVLVSRRKVKAWIIEEQGQPLIKLRKIWLTKEAPYFPIDLTYRQDGSILRIEQTLLGDVSINKQEGVREISGELA